MDDRLNPLQRYSAYRCIVKVTQYNHIHFAKNQLLVIISKQMARQSRSSAASLDQYS